MGRNSAQTCMSAFHVQLTRDHSRLHRFRELQMFVIGFGWFVVCVVQTCIVWPSDRESSLSAPKDKASGQLRPTSKGAAHLSTANMAENCG